MKGPERVVMVIVEVLHCSQKYNALQLVDPSMLTLVAQLQHGSRRLKGVKMCHEVQEQIVLGAKADVTKLTAEQNWIGHHKVLRVN
jgi:hypothetical protein